MTRTQHHELDDVAWRILRTLQSDARAPLKTLAQAAGLSVGATAERIKRLQDAGTVQRFAVELDAVKVGYPIKAIVGITATQPGKKALLERLHAAPEVLEWRLPVLLESYAIRRGSGGAGRWRGGDGGVRRIRFRQPMTVSLLTGHRRVPPYGMAGGEPGALGRNLVERADGDVVELAGNDVVDVAAGDVLVVETPGGGGYGRAGA